jgi:hypothetical protein
LFLIAVTLWHTATLLAGENVKDALPEPSVLTLFGVPSYYCYESSSSTKVTSRLAL